MAKLVSFLLVTAFTLSLLAASFHHHVYLNDNPTCPICKVAKDLSSGENSGQPPLVAPEATDIVFFQKSLARLHTPPSFSRPSRAPPA